MTRGERDDGAGGGRRSGGFGHGQQLGRFGLDCTPIERRAHVNATSRARSVNVRTAELFRQWGILDDVVAAASLPLPWTEALVYTETLAG
ncbi:MAG: FAD-dependent monooxygenase [Acidimicrobiales bacterium]